MKRSELKARLKEQREGTNEYHKQANAFLAKHLITFRAVFKYHGPHWDDEKETRNVWELMLFRGRDATAKRLTVTFGQSINDSFVEDPMYETANNGRFTKTKTQSIIPTAYDMLTCITKIDPDTFENFCSEFGYDADSRKAEKTYFAVQKEWNDVRRFFSPEELEEMQEIQ